MDMDGYKARMIKQMQQNVLQRVNVSKYIGVLFTILTFLISLKLHQN